MTYKEISGEVIKEKLPNSIVYCQYVMPLFTRSGLIEWRDPLLFLLKDWQYSKCLNEHEISVFFDGKYKYVRIFKNGCKYDPFNSPWTINREFTKEEIKSEELNHMIHIFCTNDDTDWEFIKKLKDDYKDL